MVASSEKKLSKTQATTFRDLRDFLNELARRGELIEIKREVDPILEMSAVITQAQGKAVVFQRVRNCSTPAVGNVFGDERKVEIALGAEAPDLLRAYIERANNLISPKVIKTGPVKENVLVGEKVDLHQLPLPKVNEFDGGLYIDGGIIIARDPEFGYNLSMQRLHVKGNRLTCLNAGPVQHIAQYVSRAHKAGKPLEIAIALGVDPALHIASQAKGDLALDEYALAGALRKEPVELVRCETVDLLVPARAEIVLEGIIPPNRIEEEGPFGEFAGYYNTWDLNPCPVIEYTAMTYRNNPIFQTFYLGHPPQEGTFLSALSKAAGIFRLVSNVTEVRDIYFTPGGCGMYHCVISIKKRTDAEVRLALEAILSSRRGIKLAILVDDDIDIRNPHDVEWAVATRSQFDIDAITTSGPPSPNDPSVVKRAERVGAKVGIDATKPVGTDYPVEIRIPDKLANEVKDHWTEYLVGDSDKHMFS